MGKSLSEIMAMPTLEFLEWIAFDEWRQSEREWARKKAEMGA